MLTQGEILRDRYRVIRQLGQGGMGAVYEAHDSVFDTSVALKEVTVNLSSAYDTKAQEMAQLAFEREAKILARVNHENVPHVKDYFTEDNAQFLVMELVDGDDLGKLLNQRKAPFPVSAVIDWTDRLLDALEYLHGQNPPVIHRDIKPQNLKLTTRQKIKLLDFGIAKGSDAQTADTVTNQTFIAATLNYSPIEQMLRVLDPTFLAVITHKYSSQIDAILSQTADVRSDLFALGATMYHLVTNVPPAEAVKRAVSIWDGNSDPIIDPASLNPEIPREFADFLLKAMQIRRESRFATAAEMRAELQKIITKISNPTLEKTVELNYSQFSTNETVPDVSAVSEETKILNEIPKPPIGFRGGENSQETVSFADVSADLKDTASEKTADFGFVSPETGQRPLPDTSIESRFDTANQNFVTTPQTTKRRSPLIWILPVGFVLLFVVGIGAVGVWYAVNLNSESTSANANKPEANTANKTAPNANTETSQEVVSGQQGAGSNPEEDNSNANDLSTPVRPTPAVVKPEEKTPEIAKPKTPKPTPVKKATPKPKNMDCIFTDDCE